MSDLGQIGLLAHRRFFIPGLHVSGIVKDRNGVPCQRPVFLRTRPTTAMVQSSLIYYGLSRADNGYFGFAVPSKQFDTANRRYLVEIVPLPEETDLTAIVFDHIIPT